MFEKSKNDVSMTQLVEVDNTSLCNYYHNYPAIMALASLIESSLPKQAISTIELSELVYGLSQHFYDDAADIESIYFASMLYHIGKLYLPEHLRAETSVASQSEDFDYFSRYPMYADVMMSLIPGVHDINTIIMQHREYLDGSGFPYGLHNEQISRKALILCTALDYLILTSNGGLTMSSDEALHYLNSLRDVQYSGEIIDALAKEIGNQPLLQPRLRKKNVKVSSLVQGNVLAEPLYDQNRVMLLPKGVSLSFQIIERLCERSPDAVVTIYKG